VTALDPVAAREPVKTKTRADDRQRPVALALHEVLVRGALTAGCFEAFSIVRYDVFQGDLSWRMLLIALGWSLAIIAVHAAPWAVLGAVTARLDAAWRFRICFLAWTVVVWWGRRLVDDRTPVGAGWLVALGLVLVWVVPELRWWRLPSAIEAVLRTVAILAVGSYGLLGRVPDVTYPLSQRVTFLAVSALVAVVVVEALLRAPRALAAGLVALMLGSAAIGLLPASAPDAPNVLWVLVDTARRDHTSPWSELVSTPATAKLAAEGIRFDDAVTVVPKTPASVASFFTARYPIHHGVRSLYDPLGEQQPTIAEAFSSIGYDTRAFVDNAYLSPARGYGQGFDRFHGYYELARPYGSLRYSSWVVLADRLTRRSIATFSGQTSARTTTDAVAGFLRERHRRPFFAYVHYFEPHWPYYPPPALAQQHGAPPDGRCDVNLIDQLGIGRGAMIFQNFLPEAENEKARRLYAAEMENTMAEVGRLIESLDAAGLRESTLVVFTADHGHSLGEHDYYFHHGEFLYDSSLRIPLVLRWPGHLPAGVVIDSQVRSIDVAPTVANLLRLTAFPRGDGRSLVPLWAAGDGGEQAAQQEPTVALIESDVKMFSSNTRRELEGIPGKLRALRDGRYKLILTPRHRELAFELYDLAADPGETRDLAGDPAHAEVRQRLEAQLRAVLPPEERSMLAHLIGVGRERGMPAPQPDTDPDQERLLRSLGYIE
jgi:arylsulfatase A-like enzyme